MAIENKIIISDMKLYKIIIFQWGLTQIWISIILQLQAKAYIDMI